MLAFIIETIGWLVKVLVRQPEGSRVDPQPMFPL